ncbi:MAG: ABC transporter substrate-binding protein [Gemmatimonadota bacterium]
MHKQERRTGSFRASRRAFLKTAFAVAVAPRLGLLPTLRLRIGMLYAASASDVLRGARMSASEAQRAADLLGFTLSFREQLLEPTMTADDVARWAQEHEFTAIIAAVENLAPLEALTIPVISTLDSAVNGRATNSVWHIGAVSWDATLARYGAAQLNARYRAAYDAPMTTQAWAGWFAVKVLWESAARTRTATSAAIQTYLASPRGAFDGHRGRPLRFDPETHTLK